MRSLILIACLSLSVAASADEFRYLIPLTGYLSGEDSTFYYAGTIVQNLSPRPATVQATDIYALNGGKACSASEPFTVPPQGRVTIGWGACFASISAVALLSNERLSVRTEVDTHKTRDSGWDKLILDAPTEWIPAGVTAVSEAIIREDGPRKASLLVVNPSDQTLTITVEMTRPEFDLSSATSFDVPAKSSRLISLAEVKNPSPPPFISSVDGRHLVRLTGSGPWQGGVASTFRGPSMYVPATALQAASTSTSVRGPE
jgi:hypothetical protein